MKNKIFENTTKNIIENFEKKNTLSAVREIREKFNTLNIKEIHNWLQTNYPEFVDKTKEIFNNLIYQPKTAIHNIDEAIAILGKYKVLETVILYKILKDTFLKEDSHIRKQFYHNIATAIMAHYTVPIFYKTIDSNILKFLFGFYHNFGKMLLLNFEKGMYLNIFDESITENLNFYEVENKVFARSLQILLIIRILKYLEYPEKMQNIIEFYRSPNLGKYQKESSILHISDILVSSLCIGETGDNKLPEFNKTVMNYLHLTPDLMKEVFKLIIPRFVDIPKFTKIILF